MPRSYTQVFLDPTTKLRAEVITIEDDVAVVTLQAFEDDSLYELELFAPLTSCATIAQAFDSLAQQLSRIASQAEVQA